MVKLKEKRKEVEEYITELESGYYASYKEVPDTGVEFTSMSGKGYSPDIVKEYKTCTSWYRIKIFQDR